MKKFTDMEKYATIIAVLNDLDVNDLYKVDDENYISVAELIEFINYKMALIEKRNAKRDAKSSADYERLSKAIAEVLTGHTMTVTEIINAGDAELSSLSTAKVTSVLKKMREDDNFEVEWVKTGRKSTYSM